MSKVSVEMLNFAVKLKFRNLAEIDEMTSDLDQIEVESLSFLTL